MAKPTLYKKTSIRDAQNRTRTALTTSDKTRTDAVVAKFFELFKIKHL